MAKQQSEIREVIFGYKSKATFKSKEFQKCRHKTSKCPNECGHATNVWKFYLDELEVINNPDSKQAKWCNPQSPQTEYVIGESDLNSAQLETANSLQTGDHVILDWRHDYVTVNNNSFPQRPITNLVKL